MIQIQLGRLGDIVNVIPVAYSLSRKVGRVNWLISREFEGVLEGCSYINAVRWNGGPETLREAIRNYQSGNPIVTQVFCNPDERRLTSSYALEQWRLAGMADAFGSVPLLFDQQNEARGNMLRDRALSRRHSGRPLIVACVDGISSPFGQGARLLAMLRGLDADVVDLRDVRADRVFDLLPLFNAADCLVTIDTLPLHLARAASCPVVCLLNDEWEGWRASVPPPQCVAHRTYAEASKDLGAVAATVEDISSRPACRSAVVVAQIHGESERHLKARSTWPRDALQLRFDHRPRFKEVMEGALGCGADVLIFTNDDVSFPSGSIDRIRAHAAKWKFGCSRRDPKHVGREIFWFDRQWLAKNWNDCPDPFLSVQKPDLILARWLRAQRGIKTTIENLAFDFPPVEIPAGLIYHEDHPSNWVGDVEQSKEGRHNDGLWGGTK